MGVFDGRSALVTGGASGIGLATVKRFAEEGATVTVVDLNESAGKEAAAAVGGTFIRCDASDPAQVATTFERAKDAMGALDIAYMNAGVTTGEGDISKLTDDQYFRILNINVNGVVFGVREAVKAMSDSGGSILCTASLAGLIAYAGDPIYALTKHAVVGLVRGLGPALRDRSITINAICPGIVETPLVGEAAIEMLKQANFPLIAPEDIADACVTAITSGGTGNCWAIQPGREPVQIEFRGVPGPRLEGAVGRVPPGTPGIS
jgi:NAD(P)-dependent dehydrogenase (short-subunit alcohol dehydrogenase family)